VQSTSNIDTRHRDRRRDAAEALLDAALQP
jgi:hypothetical protein